jgi:hypothetical protein
MGISGIDGASIIQQRQAGACGLSAAIIRPSRCKPPRAVPPIQDAGAAQTSSLTLGRSDP